MSALLLNDKPGPVVQEIEQARTTTAVRRLDGPRNGILLTFISKAGVHLGGTDLTLADLHGTDLTLAHLSGADLHGADLHGSNLTQVDLIRATLTGANLTGTKLIHDYVYSANLRRAHLRGANLFDAKLALADLRGADLRGAIGKTVRQLEQETYLLKGLVLRNATPGAKYRRLFA